MDFLPKEVEDIIIKYTNQIDHFQKLKKNLEKIRKIKYEIFQDNYHGIERSRRGKIHYYYYNGYFQVENYYKFTVFEINEDNYNYSESEERNYW